MTESLKSGNGSAVRMGEPEETRKITRSIEWKLDLADRIMQVDALPEDACKLIIKSIETRMHEGAAAEGFQQINIDEAIAQYGDVREALKRYLKGWFQLNIPLEGGSLGLAPTDAPPIVQRVWKNLEKLLLHPLEDEVRISSEVYKRTEAFEAAAREYSDRLAAALKTFEKLAAPKKEWAEKLHEAYTNVERAEKDLGELAKKYDAEKSAHEAAEKHIETQEKQIDGIRKEAERLYNIQKDKLKAAESAIEQKGDLIKDLTSEVDSTKTANDELAKKVESLESELKAKSAEVKKERRDRRIYQVQSVRVRHEYDLKEQDFIQVKEQVNFERGKKEEAEKEAAEQKKRADSLDGKLASTRQGRKGWYAAAAASVLALGLLIYRPSGKVAPVENVPQEVVTDYSKEHVTVKFGSAHYRIHVDRLNEIYQDIQKDQQKSGRQFTPADRKQYFEKKIEGTRQIK